MAVDISPGVLLPMSFIKSDIEHRMSLRTHLLETTLGKQINRPMDCALEIPEIDNQQGGKSHIAWPRTLGLGKHEWVALFNWVRYEDGETISPFWQLLVCLYSWSATGFHEISSAILDDGRHLDQCYMKLLKATCRDWDETYLILQSALYLLMA